MKELITATAGIIILLAFVLQFTQIQVVNSHISTIDQCVNVFKERARQEGKITAGNAEELRQAVSRRTGVSGSEIGISGTDHIRMRGETIHYIVRVPVRGLVGVPSFWSIEGKENGFIYEIDRYAASEYVGRNT